MYNFIEKANLILAGKFVFDRLWDMEADVRIVDNTDLNWSLKPFDDEEWTYMLNRMEYLIDLAQAYSLTSNPKYQSYVIFLIENWVENNEINSHNLRTIDTGMRLLNWAEAYNRINTAPSERVKKAIKEQCDFLVKSYRLKDDLSNWGVFQSIGCLACEEYISNEASVFWKDKLRVQLDMQINIEGFHWENSIMYHNQVLLSLCRLKQLKDFNLEPIIKLMGNATALLVKPNKMQVMQNDSDNTSVVGLLQFVSKIINESTAFTGVDQISQLYCKEQTLMGKSLDLFEVKPKSGLIVYRKNNLFFSLHNHSYGSSHSHIMPAHINFYADEDILVDPGRFSYQNIDERYILKSIRSHNSPILGSHLSEEIKNSWDTSVNTERVSISGENLQDIIISKACYACGGVLITRRAFIIDRSLLVIDQYGTNTDEKIEVNLILAPNLKLKNKSQLSNKYYITHNYQNSIIETTPYSRGYNQIEDTSKLVLYDENGSTKYLGLFEKNSICKYTLSGPYHVWTISTMTQKLKICILESEIQIGPKIVQIDEYKINGKVVVINEKTGKIDRVEM